MPNLVELFGAISLFSKLTMAVPIAAFGLAASYAFRPTVHKLALMRPVSLAAIFATVNGLIGGWIATLADIPAPPDGTLPHTTIVALSQGLAASLTVGFVCVGFLAAAWLLVTVGMVRRGDAEAA